MTVPRGPLVIADAIPSPATAATDQQLYGYDATLGGTRAFNPTGASELAYSANTTGTATTCSFTGTPPGVGTPVTVPNTAITVLADARIVWLEFGAFAWQTAAGVGDAYLELVETTGGGSTVVARDVRPLPNSTALVADIFSLFKRYRLGAVASTRTFQLQIHVAASTGTPTFGVGNGNTVGAISPTDPTYLRASAS